MSITELSISRPSLIIVIFTVLGVLGLFSYQQLSYELIPKFDAPVVIATTAYPGASPAEVENTVTKKVEDALSGLENVESMRSTSRENVSVVVVNLKQGTDVNQSLQDAQRKINEVQSTLPDEVKTPVIGKFSSDQFPILNIGAYAQVSAIEFFDLAKNRIQPALASVPGVAQVNLIGGQEREIRINVNQAKLEEYRLSILQVVQAVRSSNLDFPTGKIKNDDNQVTVRLAGKLNAVDELRALIVSNNQTTNTPITLGDLAEVQDSPKEAEDISRVNGKDALGIMVLKQTDANAVAVSDLVRKQLNLLEKQFTKEGLSFEVSNDSSQFTLEAVDAVVHDLSLAIVLVAAVMLLFLHSFRNALIVMLAIPTSLVATFILMYAFDFTLNLMTLLAMSLVIGILVDDSIVVLENIYRHLEMGKDKREASIQGRKEIAFTALAITLVDVVVFLPIALAGGIVGNIMRQFALVVVFSTLMSLFVSFTLTPMLASRFSRLEHLNNKSLGGMIFSGFEKLIDRLTEAYISTLNWSLRHKFIVLGSTAVLFFSSFMLVGKGFIGAAFIANSDRGEFIINLELPKDATLKETNAMAQQAETFLLNQEGVSGVFTQVGRTTAMFSGGGGQANLSEINVKLVGKEARSFSTDFFARDMKIELEKRLAGVKVTSGPVSFFGGADESPIQIIVSSTDFDKAEAYAKQLLAWTRETPGALEPKLSYEEGNPELKIDIDREQMADLGLNLQTVGATLQTAFAGNTDAKFSEKGNEYDINIRLDAFDRRNAEDLAALTFLNSRGELIELQQFADVVPGTGPSQLERQDRINSVTLLSKVLGRPSGSVGADIQAKMAENPPPAGVLIAYEADLKNQAEGFGSLGLAFLAALLFVYLIMVALYDSWVYPFVVLFSIPVAIVGAFLAMALTMSTLDIFSILGLIMLVGLVGKNAILLVDFANQRKEDGLSSFDALLDAGRTRLRPILMTTIAMVFGMMPIALAQGAGAEWKNGLAWALIGGLTSSMLLTLVVVPAVYLLVDQTSALLSKIFNRNNSAGGQAANKQPKSTPILEEAAV